MRSSAVARNQVPPATPTAPVMVAKASPGTVWNLVR